MTASVLDIRDATVVYGGRTVLSVEHLSLFPGKILAIVGPNGAGKSTLLCVLALLETPTTGGVYFDSQPVRWDAASLLTLRRRMGTVFQSPLLCNTTVYGNIALGLKFREIGRAHV